MGNEVKFNIEYIKAAIPGLSVVLFGPQRPQPENLNLLCIELCEHFIALEVHAPNMMSQYQFMFEAFLAAYPHFVPQLPHYRDCARAGKEVERGSPLSPGLSASDSFDRRTPASARIPVRHSPHPLHVGNAFDDDDVELELPPPRRAGLGTRV